MEGETPQPTRLETAKITALEKGAERQRAIKEKTGGFLSRIKEKTNTLVQFTLGSPEAAKFLGKEGVKLSQEKGTELKNSALELRNRFVERVVETKDRLIERGVETSNRLVNRFNEIKTKTTNKVAELSKRAAVQGLKPFQWVEERLESAYQVPATIREAQAGLAEKGVSKAELNAQETEEAYEQLLKQIQEQRDRKLEQLAATREAAESRQNELLEKASQRRTDAQNNFGKVRAVIEGLQTS